jgi:hypothetical protein
MNTLTIIANVLVILTFFIHTFMGDKELRVIEPQNENAKDHLKYEKWTMARGAFHIVSMDFLLASIVITLINFTNYFSDVNLILKIMALYFFAYSIGFLLSVMISKQFPKNYFKLPQWILLLVISAIIYLGSL